MNYTLEEYLEDIKRHLSCFQTEDELKEYCTFDYTFEEILENKEYFESCLNKELSTYKALLFFEKKKKKDKLLWDNYKICILPHPIYEEGVFLQWELHMKDHETSSIYGKTFDIYEDAIECGLQECLKLINKI